MLNTISSCLQLENTYLPEFAFYAEFKINNGREVKIEFTSISPLVVVNTHQLFQHCKTQRSLFNLKTLIYLDNFK